MVEPAFVSYQYDLVDAAILTYAYADKDERDDHIAHIKVFLHPWYERTANVETTIIRR